MPEASQHNFSILLLRIKSPGLVRILAEPRLVQVGGLSTWEEEQEPWGALGWLCRGLQERLPQPEDIAGWTEVNWRKSEEAMLHLGPKCWAKPGEQISKVWLSTPNSLLHQLAQGIQSFALCFHIFPTLHPAAVSVCAVPGMQNLS